MSDGTGRGRTQGSELPSATSCCLLRRAFVLLKAGARRKILNRFGLLIKEKGVTHLVLGLPRNMNGSLGPMAEKVQDFGRQLFEKNPEVQLSYWDERLTTSAAQRTLVEADVSRRRRRQVVDKVAAVLILQGYMDAHCCKN